MAVHHVRRQAEFHADAAHLVLEQLAQRLDQAELHVLGQAADVVVRLDDVRLAGLAAGRFDHVRIDGALRQPLHVRQLGRLLFEDLHEQAADDLALGFRFIDALERGEIALGGVDPDDFDAHMLGKHGHDLVAFLPAQQAGVDEHTGQPLADGLVQQRRHHRGIDAAGQTEQHLVIADLGAHARDLVVDDVGRGPQRAAAADVLHEARQQGLAGLGVGHFRMELHAVIATALIGHGHDRHGVGRGGHGEAVRHTGHAVAVAHPYVQPRRLAGGVINAIQQAAGVVDIDRGGAEFAVVAGFDQAAELHRHGLHAVADAEHRHLQREHFLGRARRTGFGGRFRTTGQDDALRRERGDVGRVVVPGPDLAVHAGLADAAGDQLGVLRAEIEDEDLVAMDVGHFSLRGNSAVLW